MKLELKHIAPYLSYGLKMIDISSRVTTELNAHNLTYLIAFLDEEIKPILRPMTTTELTKYFILIFDEDIDVRTFLSEEFLDSHGIDFEKIPDFKIEWLPFGVVDLFLKHHFDVFGLIPQGLAIDANSLKSK